MVLAHHGRIVPLAELRLDCGISRDGSKASNLLRAARKHGLVAKGFKKEPGALRFMRPPMILHWNFNHFVVLRGFGRKGAYINDPATGAVTVPDSELEAAFTGVVLTFEKDDAFERGGQNPSFVGALRRRLAGCVAAIAFVVLAGLALVVPGLVGATFNTIFVDQVLIHGLSAWVRPLMLAMVATGVLIFGLTALQQRYLMRLENRLSLHGSSRFFWHVLRLPVRFFSQRFAGDIADRVGINDKVSRMLSGDLASTTVSLLLIVFYGVLLFRYDVQLAAVGLVTAVLNLLALQLVAKRRVQLTQRLTSDRGKLIGTAMGALQNIDSLKASGGEADFFARWSGQQAKVVAVEQRIRMTTMVLSSVPPLLMAINTALILGLGGLRIMDGQLTIGMLIAFQSLLGAFLGPINHMIDLGSVAQEIKGDMTRLDDVLEARLDRGMAEETATRQAPRKLSGTIELRNVTFGYSPLEQPLLKDFNLSLAPGRRVALVGGSGSGKSTVARLVAGLFEPWSGEVLFDGRPRAAIARSTLSQSLAMVDQDICLFEDTITANLTLWDGTVPESEVRAAARDACVHDDIMGRASGYNGRLDEGGRNFSGGQRQRLEIARALVSRPSILVLDEATSALDPTTEKAVDDNLRRRGCTCLIVAHRLSTIRDCDEILVLNTGTVVQRGTHDELMAQPGPYRTLIAAEAA
jgi:NHLM bacteriocin system ABC transporter peptidase/ATP-binding protein